MSNIIVKRQFGKDVPPEAQDPESEAYYEWIQRTMIEVEKRTIIWPLSPRTLEATQDPDGSFSVK